MARFETERTFQTGEMPRAVFYVSCRTGITVETLGQGLLTQFQGMPFEHISLPYTDTLEKAQQVVERINRAAAETGIRPIVFTTLIDPELRRCVARSEGVFFDFLGRFIGPLSEELGVEPAQAMGLSHGLVDYDRYMARIDAVQFAQLNDEALRMKDYHEADLILIGVSRSGKTPTCLYLALQFGIRAANFTLQLEDLERCALPEKLLALRERLFGVTIDPQRLHQIRSQRKPDSDYASLPQCRRETKLAEALFRDHDIPFANATAVSIEEIATKIMQRCHLERRI
ncbi:MAG: pyruvate, water dikinase regulatory protein [Gammaproteobacteria bacterium]